MKFVLNAHNHLISLEEWGDAPASNRTDPVEESSKSSPLAEEAARSRRGGDAGEGVIRECDKPKDNGRIRPAMNRLND